MAGRLDGQVAVITGAASGIGAASARLFASEGARLALADVNDVELQAVVDELRASGHEVISVETDVSDEQQVQRLVQTAVSAYGQLNILFSNAGIGKRGKVTDLATGDFERIIAVNLRGGFLCAKHAIPEIAVAGGGSVIFTASELALVGSPNNPAYCASKAGLIGMARAMALDHAEQSIRVNCLCPGAVDTPMLRGSIASAADPVAYQAGLNADMPLGRVGQADEIARAALFLASNDSSFVTGHALVADGGYTAR